MKSESIQLKLQHFIRYNNELIYSVITIQLVTPSAIVTKSLALPHVGQPKISSRLDKCAPSLDCVLFVEGFTIRE